MAARFKVDENVPREAQALLRGGGHDAQTIHDERLVGYPDASILNACLNEDRVLITLDLDFADIKAVPASRPSTNRANDVAVTFRRAAARARSWRAVRA